MLDYTTLPNRDNMEPGLRRYFERGIQTGDFLHALLSNDLRRTFERADDTNTPLVRDLVRWLYKEAPARAWGSETAVRDWIKGGGLAVLYPSAQAPANDDSVG
jgi:hypothetical protein